MQFLHRKTLSAIALGIMAAHPALAQRLEEVVVTATKRAESLQDVPISMISMSGDSIKDMAVTTAADFSADMPAIPITQSPIGNFIFIRGIGTPGVNQGIEHSVSIFHDSIYMGRSQLSRAPFMDLQALVPGSQHRTPLGNKTRNEVLGQSRSSGSVPATGLFRLH